MPLNTQKPQLLSDSRVYAPVNGTEKLIDDVHCSMIRFQISSATWSSATLKTSTPKIIVMLKKVLLAAAIVIASPALVSAQDLFWSFSPTSVELYPDDPGNASLYIFSDGLFGFDALDLEFTVTVSGGEVRFTGGEAFNPVFDGIGGRKFDSSEITVDAAGTSARLFSVNITQNGVNPVLGPLFDPGFEPNVGPNGAALLARLDFDFQYGSRPEFNFSLGTQGAFALPSTVLNPTLAPDLENICYDYIHEFYYHGDFNNDKAVDFLDIAPFVSALAFGSNNIIADMNVDGSVNFLDIAPFIETLQTQSLVEYSFLELNSCDWGGPDN